MTGLICPGCKCSRFRLGFQTYGNKYLFYLRCSSCGFTVNFFPVPFCFEPEEHDKLILADNDSAYNFIDLP